MVPLAGFVLAILCSHRSLGLVPALESKNGAIILWAARISTVFYLFLLPALLLYKSSPSMSGLGYWSMPHCLFEGAAVFTVLIDGSVRIVTSIVTEAVVFHLHLQVFNPSARHANVAGAGMSSSLLHFSSVLEYVAAVTEKRKRKTKNKFGIINT